MEKDSSPKPSLIFLSELVLKLRGRVEFFKTKYAKLHDAVLKTYESESRLLEKAKALNQQFIEGKANLEQIGSKDHEIKEEIDDLKAESAKAETEVAICEERDAMLHLEIAELERQKVEIQEEKEEKEQEVAEALAPRILALQTSIDELKLENSKNGELSDLLTTQVGLIFVVFFLNKFWPLSREQKWEKPWRKPNARAHS